MKTLLKVLPIPLLLLILDRLSRYMALAIFAPTDGVWVEVGRWNLTYMNTFHTFTDSAAVEWVGYGIQVGLIAVMLAVAVYLKVTYPILLPLAIFIGGASSNIADIMLWDAVVDPIMIKYTADSWIAYNFNLADICIVAGFVTYVITLMRNVK